MKKRSKKSKTRVLSSKNQDGDLPNVDQSMDEADSQLTNLDAGWSDEKCNLPADHLTKLSLEILCHILSFLSLRYVMRMDSMNKKLHEAVSLHLRVRKKVDFAEAELFGWISEELTDARLEKFLKRCPDLKHIYGFHPKYVSQRRLRGTTMLSVPGIIEALGVCKNLRGIETSDCLVLEAVMNYLPSVEILGTFKNRNGLFPANDFCCLTLTENPKITSLHLVGIFVPDLPPMQYLKHLHLRWISFKGPHPFRDFSAVKLQSFVMAHCAGPLSALKYVPLITSLAGARYLSRLEMIRVPFLGGLLQHLIQDSWHLCAFWMLRSVKLGACKHALEMDVGFLAITAAKRIEELCIQPSLTKDSLFVALKMADVTFEMFETLHLGFVDSFPEPGSWSNHELMMEGLMDVTESPALITDIGMKAAGSCFPTLKHLEIYNCPHILRPTSWFTEGAASWEKMTDLTLRRCHALKLEDFCNFLSKLPSLQSLHLEHMFREPPKGCSRVGLSAGTGMGMSSSVLNQHYQQAANEAAQNNNNNNDDQNANEMEDDDNDDDDDDDDDDGEQVVNNEIANEHNGNNIEDQGNNEIGEEIANENVECEETANQNTENLTNQNPESSREEKNHECSSNVTSPSGSKAKGEIISGVKEGASDSSDYKKEEDKDKGYLDDSGFDMMDCDFDLDYNIDDDNDDDVDDDNLDVLSNSENKEKNGKTNSSSESKESSGSMTTDKNQSDILNTIDKGSTESVSMETNVTKDSNRTFGLKECSSIRNKDSDKETQTTDDNKEGTAVGHSQVAGCSTWQTPNCNTETLQKKGSLDSVISQNVSHKCSQGSSSICSQGSSSMQSLGRENKNKTSDSQLCDDSASDLAMDDSEFEEVSMETVIIGPVGGNRGVGSPGTRGLIVIEDDPIEDDVWAESICGNKSNFPSSSLVKGVSVSTSVSDSIEITDKINRKSENELLKCDSEIRESCDITHIATQMFEEPYSKDEKHEDNKKELMDKRKVIMSDSLSSTRAARKCVAPASVKPWEITGVKVSTASASTFSSVATDVCLSSEFNEGNCQNTLDKGSQHTNKSLPTEQHSNMQEVKEIPVNSDMSPDKRSNVRNSKKAEDNTIKNMSSICDKTENTNPPSTNILARRGKSLNGSKKGLVKKSKPSSDLDACQSDTISPNVNNSKKQKLSSDPDPCKSRCGLYVDYSHEYKALSDCDPCKSSTSSLHVSHSKESEYASNIHPHSSGTVSSCVNNSQISIDSNDSKDPSDQIGSAESSDGQKPKPESNSSHECHSDKRLNDSDNKTERRGKSLCGKKKGLVIKQSKTKETADSEKNNLDTEDQTMSDVSEKTEMCDQSCMARTDEIRQTMTKTDNVKVIFSKTAKASKGRRRSKPKAYAGPKTNMCDCSTSTSDPVIEDDHVQILRISSKSLLSVSLNVVGITSLVLEDCPQLSKLSGHACRVLKTVKICNSPMLRQVEFTHCKKLDEEMVAKEVASQNPERNKVVYLRPLHQINPISLEQKLFSSAGIHHHICIVYDFNERACDSHYNRLRVATWGDLITGVNVELLDLYGFPCWSEARWRPKYPWGRNIYKMHGRNGNGSLWSLITDIPWLRPLSECPRLSEDNIHRLDHVPGLYCPNTKGHFGVTQALEDLTLEIAEHKTAGTAVMSRTCIVYMNLSDVAGLPSYDPVFV